MASNSGRINGVSLYLPTIPTQTPQKRLENPTVKPAPNNINPNEVKYTSPSISYCKLKVTLRTWKIIIPLHSVGKNIYKQLLVNYIYWGTPKEHNQEKEDCLWQIYYLLSMWIEAPKSRENHFDINALFKNTWIRKFKSQLTFTFFAAASHLSGPLRKQEFTSTGSKRHGSWIVDFEPFCLFLCFEVCCLSS